MLVELVVLDEVAVDAVYVPLVVVLVEVPVADDGSNAETVPTGELDFLVKVGI